MDTFLKTHPEQDLNLYLTKELPYESQRRHFKFLFFAGGGSVIFQTNHFEILLG